MTSVFSVEAMIPRAASLCLGGLILPGMGSSWGTSACSLSCTWAGRHPTIQLFQWQLLHRNSAFLCGRERHQLPKTWTSDEMAVFGTVIRAVGSSSSHLSRRCPRFLQSSLFPCLFLYSPLPPELTRKLNSDTVVTPH